MCPLMWLVLMVVFVVFYLVCFIVLYFECGARVESRVDFFKTNFKFIF